MTRCEIVRCTACKAEAIRKGRGNQANAKLFVTLNNAIRHERLLKSYTSR